ncbi:MAG: tyrosine-type recombinase/integrase [Acidimicrobiales bacterium]
MFLEASADRLTRDAAARMVRGVAKAAGITKRIGPHSLRHSFITAAFDASVRRGSVQPLARPAEEPATSASPTAH